MIDFTQLPISIIVVKVYWRLRGDPSSKSKLNSKFFSVDKKLDEKRIHYFDKKIDLTALL